MNTLDTLYQKSARLNRDIERAAASGDEAYAQTLCARLVAVEAAIHSSPQHQRTEKAIALAGHVW